MARSLEKRPLGRTGLESTFGGFGALEIGRDWGLGDTGEILAGAEVVGLVLDVDGEVFGCRCAVA